MDTSKIDGFSLYKNGLHWHTPTGELALSRASCIKGSAFEANAAVSDAQVEAALAARRSAAIEKIRSLELPKEAETEKLATVQSGEWEKANRQAIRDSLVHRAAAEIGEKKYQNIMSRAHKMSIALAEELASCIE